MRDTSTTSRPAARTIVVHLNIEVSATDPRSAVAPQTFPAGSRVVLTADIDRYPHFIAPAGATGTVVDIGDESVFAVRLDEYLEGAEDWDNEVHWSEGDALDDIPMRSLALLDDDGDDYGDPDRFEALRRAKQPLGNGTRREIVSISFSMVKS